LDLDHIVFQNYEGPIKCFRCGHVMHVKATLGIVDSIESSSVLPPHSLESAVRRTPRNPEM
jgi:hypothetical protein